MTKEARLEPSEQPSSASIPIVNESGTARIVQRVSSPPPETQPADYNLRIVGPLVRWVVEKHGEGRLADLARGAGIDPVSLANSTGWMSLKQCETFLSGVLALAGGMKEFDDVCVYRVVESWGAFRYIAWALTPLAMYKTAARANKTLSTVAEFTTREVNSRRIVVTYTGTKKESHLLCATRKGALKNVPAFFGLPVARLQEIKCIANGDDACEYDISWDEQRRWLPTALGIAAGVGAAALLRVSAVDAYTLLIFPPMLGGALGYLADRSRNNQANVANVQETNIALQQLISDDAEARRELMALGQRQRDWATLVEEAYTSRLDGLQGVMKQAEEMQSARESTLLGFSHDLRNPLMVLASTVDFLRDNSDALGDEGPALIEDVEGSIAQMKRMLGDFVSAATSKKAIVRLAPQKLDVAVLTTSLTRRLRALLQGRPIVPSVMQTREAPDAIYFDPLVFDRVTDNLLTNAAKYTERGSIVVEVTGDDEFIVIQVSDSGRGIAEAELERIFQPGGSIKDQRARDSFGVGLSVVLQLLEQVGGSLEVMSQPGRGTTFWANFPIGSEATLRQSVRPSIPVSTNERAAPQNPLSGRVRIRKPPA